MGSMVVKSAAACNAAFTRIMFSGSGGWSIENVLSNASDKLRDIGAALMIVIGIVMIIVGIFKIAQGLISHGKTQVNWVVNILLIIIGALFCAGGAFFKDTLTASNESGLGNALSNELEELGQ